MNPLEDKRVKYIANYLDTAVEAKTSINGKTEFQGVLAYQPNKNVLMKTRLSSADGVAAALVLKFWGNPSLSLAVTGGIRSQESGFLGLNLVVQNHGKTVFPATDFGTNAPGGFRWEQMREQELDDRLPSKGRFQEEKPRDVDLLF